MSDLEIVFRTVLMLVCLINHCFLVDTDQDSENDISNNCPNLQHIDDPLYLLGGDYEYQDVDLNKQKDNIEADDTIHQGYTQVQSTKSCKKSTRYLKTKRKLKGSKNYRKRLKKKKKHNKRRKKRNKTK